MTQLETRREQKIHTNKYITFFLDKEEYGVEISKVREIIGIMDITSTPNTPPYIKGVLNLRGKVIPVVDMRLKFSMEEVPYSERTCIIVMELINNAKTTLIGGLVDTVSEVLHVNAEDIEEAPSFGVNVNTDAILGMAKINNKVKILLDIDKVLGIDEIKILKNLEDDSDIN